MSLRADPSQAGEQAPDRTVIEITGANRMTFLQGLVSNDVSQVLRGKLVYAALLSPQGKYLADFFMARAGRAVLIDVKSDLAEGLMERFEIYRLRTDVKIAQSGLNVVRGLGPAPEHALADPRHEALGWRRYGGLPGLSPVIDWDGIRVRHCIPETGIELIPGESYILEAGFERLNGVDFRKGCYVGQEVTARMRHKTELRKGLVRVGIDGAAAVGTEITDAEGRAAGTLFTQWNGQALAHLRLDRARGVLIAGGARLAMLDGAETALN